VICIFCVFFYIKKIDQLLKNKLEYVSVVVKEMYHDLYTIRYARKFCINAVYPLLAYRPFVIENRMREMETQACSSQKNLKIQPADVLSHRTSPFVIIVTGCS
jgi:hypothetical protein